MNVRNIVLIAVGMIGAAFGGAAIKAAISDPEVNVEAVELIGMSGTPVGTRPPSGSVGEPSPEVGEPVVVQSVDGLEQLIGNLRAGEYPDDWDVSGVEVDFGPDGWISGAPSFGDFDGDGIDEPLLVELRGLEGRTVTLGVRYSVDDDRDDAHAFTVEGRAFRDPAGGPAPWQTTNDGVEASREEIAAAAAAAVGSGAVTLDIERETDDGWTNWDVDVRANDGRIYQVYLDLAGTVLDVRPDTD